jgi:hypothetical protein
LVEVRKLSTARLRRIGRPYRSTLGTFSTYRRP